ncbi:hypothetical protein AALB16_11865 [Lachnospiraceae bacterium 62-35]
MKLCFTIVMRSDELAGAGKRRVPIHIRERNACETLFHNYNTFRGIGRCRQKARANT